VKVDAPEGELTDTGEPEVKLTVIEPAPKPTPVGVGAEGGGAVDSDDEPSDSASDVTEDDGESE
jgi:hypothetical protein